MGAPKWTAKRLAEYSDKLKDSADLDELRLRLGHLAEALGFGRLTYHLVKYPSVGDLLPSFITDYPEEWISRYARRGYWRVDPVMLAALRRTAPFAWRDLRIDGYSSDQIRFMGEASDFGITDGCTVPVHAPGSFAIFSAVAEGSTRDRARNLATGRPWLTMAALCAHERALQLFLPTLPTEDVDLLTARERECAVWLVAGKTGPEIGEILGISDQTVTSHVKSAMRKTGTFTRAHLVARLLAKGVITP